MVSATPVTLSSKRSVAVWPSSSSTSDRVTVVNPGSSAVTRNTPTRAAMRNAPDSLVTPVNMFPVACARP
jgi:hypothetical protein